MRESTRIYVRTIQFLLLGILSIVSYAHLGSVAWLVIGVIAAGLAIWSLVRARAVGHAPAPPIANPRIVKRLSIACGAGGAFFLIAMLWRIDGEWNRVVEPASLWLAALWIVLLGVAVSAPLELRSARAEDPEAGGR
jgi:hypothetical protein